MNRPCIRCGELTITSPCAECSTVVARKRRKHQHRDNPASRGYGTAWRKLSERARRAQPWCTDCGTTERLTLDHLPSAWERYEARLPLRLAVDVQVVCGPCNSARGSSRPGSTRAQTRGGEANPAQLDQRRWAKSVSHSENRSQVAS